MTTTTVTAQPMRFTSTEHVGEFTLPDLIAANDLDEVLIDLLRELAALDVGGMFTLDLGAGGKIIYTRLA